jgi:hypothetical protein
MSTLSTALTASTFHRSRCHTRCTASDCPLLYNGCPHSPSGSPMFAPGGISRSFSRQTCLCLTAQIHGSARGDTLACFSRVSRLPRRQFAVAHHVVNSASVSNDYPQVHERDLKDYGHDTTGEGIGPHSKRTLASLSMDGKVSVSDSCPKCDDRIDLDSRLPSHLALRCLSSLLTSLIYRSAL